MACAGSIPPSVVYRRREACGAPSSCAPPLPSLLLMGLHSDSEQTSVKAGGCGLANLPDNASATFAASPSAVSSGRAFAMTNDGTALLRTRITRQMTGGTGRDCPYVQLSASEDEESERAEVLRRSSEGSLLGENQSPSSQRGAATRFGTRQGNSDNVILQRKGKSRFLRL